jgi:sugar O-acyltransferase (sialic acid O-acetyltransferase NeuD family)
MSPGRLLIFGASGHGKVIADAATLAGWRVIGFADDDPGKRGVLLLGHEVLAIGVDGAARLLAEHDAHFVVGIGAGRARERRFGRLLDRGGRPATIVHPEATVAGSARIGDGSAVFAGAVINPDATVGVDCIVNTAATLDHDCVLGDHAHLSPGVHCGGGVTIGAGTHVGIGASIIQGIRIGAGVVIGAGSVVIRDVPDGVVAFGGPARVVRQLG